MRGARGIFGDAKSGFIEITDLQFRPRISGSCRLLIPIGRQLGILRDAVAGEIVCGELDLLVNMRLGRRGSGATVVEGMSVAAAGAARIFVCAQIKTQKAAAEMAKAR